MGNIFNKSGLCQDVGNVNIDRIVENVEILEKKEEEKNLYADIVKKGISPGVLQPKLPLKKVLMVVKTGMKDGQKKSKEIKYNEDWPIDGAMKNNFKEMPRCDLLLTNRFECLLNIKTDKKYKKNLKPEQKTKKNIKIENSKKQKLI